MYVDYAYISLKAISTLKLRCSKTTIWSNMEMGYIHPLNTDFSYEGNVTES
jgi:hypothetical protein